MDNLTLIEIQKLAKMICDVADNVTDIEFVSRGKGSFCMTLFQKQKKKFDNKKFMSYRRIWNCNYLGIQDIVQSILHSRSNIPINIKKTLPLHEKETNIANLNNVSQEICNIENWSPVKHEEEDDINDSNTKLDVVNDKTLCNIFDTPQRYVLRPTRTLLSDTNNFEDFSNVIEEDESEINVINDDPNYVPNNNSDSSYEIDVMNDGYVPNNNNSDSSDSSLKYNQQNSKLSVQKKFCILQGRFHVQRTVIFDEYENVNKNKIREEIQNKMVHSLNFPCPLQFYGGVRRNANCLITYAKCRYSSHVQQFKFDISNIHDAIINIFVSSTKCTEILHEGRPIFCTLKGEAREKAQLEMRHVSPRMLQLSTLKNVDHELAQDGYFQDLRMLSTYQKAKSEENNKNDLHLCSLDLSDLFQQYIIDQQSNDPYIQSTGLPFYVHMYTEEQLNVLDKSDIIVYFDATGSVVRKPKDIKCKRILYYAVAVNKKNIVLPIAEMVSSVHNTTAISIFLKTFRHFLQSKHFTWPLFSIIVVDWSWALINAVMSEWNMTTLSAYLEEVYIALNKKENLRSDLIIVHNCCAHFQKRVSSTIHKKFPKHIKSKSFILECMGVLIHCDSLDDLDYCYEQFMTVLLTSCSTEAHNSIVNINKFHTTQYKYDDIFDVYSDTESNIDLFDENYKVEGRIFIDSPFFKRYNSKLYGLKNKIQNNNIENTNIYYAPTIAEYITNHYIPFIPMWSALLLKIVVPGTLRLSNANIESYFNIVKKYVLNGEVNLKVGRFIKKMKEYNKQLCAELKLNMPLKRRRRNIQCHDIQNINNILTEETWQRKRKPLYSHFEGRLLGRISKKHKVNTSTPISNKNSETSDLSALNLSESSTHANALANGLFLDADYYMQSSDPTLTIGQYGSLINAPVIGFDVYNLCAEEFYTLKEKNWIDGKIIDCFTISLLNNASHNFVYVPTNYTYYMLGDFYKRSKDEQWRMYNITNPISGTMLLPYLYASHWYLLIIDFNKHTILHLDPKYLVSPDKERAITAFKNYMKESSLLGTNNEHVYDRSWREITCNDRPLQNDSYNCGIYVIYYIMNIIRNESFDTNFKPAEYRHVVAESLLKASSCMKDVCQYCFSNRKRPLVMCNTCRRWVHQLCLKRKFDCTTNWKNPDAKYRCMLCTKGFRPWMKYVK